MESGCPRLEQSITANSRVSQGLFFKAAKTKRLGLPGRFVRCAMLLVLAHGAPQFAQLRHPIFRLARLSLG
jgi:hypothetical protein